MKSQSCAPLFPNWRNYVLTQIEKFKMSGKGIISYRLWVFS